MKTDLLLRVASTVVLLGCAVPPPASAAPPQGEAEAPVLRFGDPPALAYSKPFFAGTSYDPSVPAPDAILGQTHGTRLSHHSEVLSCFEALAAASERVTLHPYARTHEGRQLVYAVISSQANQTRMEQIRANLARLADPRGLSDEDARGIIARTPPVAWMAYSIHGDELSGTDAAIALGYHLAAGTNAQVEELLEKIVVVIDPCMNPDGRERIIGMVEQSAGYTPNLDYASMHRGRWPHGRGNHYLFDLNRDWMVGTQPETRGRWSAVLDFNPQLFVDAHEMGSLDTFLFYPQAEPVHPAFGPRHVEWQRIFAAGAARAFDEHGWSYYTREWADGWAPFYSDSWSSLAGAVGILYEQAGTAGSPLRRASGEILTYREAVHHQAAASLANLRTLAEQRTALLESYLADKRANVAAETPGNDRVFVLRPGGHSGREREFLRMLLGQGVEVFRATAAFSGTDAASAVGEAEVEVAFPPGSLVVPARQPQSRMVRAYLEFDTRMSATALQGEREELERKQSSKIYDVTAWSIPHALALDAWWCDAPEVDLERVQEVPAAEGALVECAAPVAWVVDGTDDGAVAFAAGAMERGLSVTISDAAFSAAGRSFSRSSLVLRRAENPGELAELRARVLEAAQRSAVQVIEASTGRSPDEGPDLGGGHFGLLARPRIAVLANTPVSSDRYGHLWHHLDTVLGVPFTILDATSFRRPDLRRYNVLILPPGGLDGVLRSAEEGLAAWVRAGGTLVACAESAAALTRERLGLASAVRRRDVLEDLDPYLLAARREREARAVEIDERLVWEGTPAEAAAESDDGEEESDADSGDNAPSEPAEDRDAWMRTFSPFGVNLLAHTDSDAWITAGCAERMPVPFSGSTVLHARSGVAVRLATAEHLRLGGLLWPEARERTAEGAYVVVESKGHGQVILFAAMPAFRGYNHGTARLFSNAVIYGPGLGANPPLDW
ncbi:MAG: M14 family metallopeptidase [Planctomycetota bacterium]|nr:M14 family metallopeptidase [Planctomycetota bacterium]